MKEVAKVISFFAHPSVAAIEITASTLKISDKVKIKGHTTDFEQEVESMQIENEPVEEVKSGDKVGLKVKNRVRSNDIIYKLEEGEEK